MFSPAGVSRSYTDLFEGPFMVFLNQDSASRGRPKAPEGLATLPENRSVSREFDFALKLWRGKRKKRCVNKHAARLASLFPIPARLKRPCWCRRG